MTCSLLRRLAAIFYDCLLLLSLLFVGTLLVIPFNSGDAISHGNILYNAYLLIVSYLYFTWQWRHGGQTLGMLAWKIKLVDTNSQNVSWKKATIRYLLAIISLVCIGAGFIWSIFDNAKLTFHDRYSGSRLILVAK